MDLEQIFKKCFLKYLGPFAVRAFNDTFKHGELSATQKEGVIIYIPKGDKPREYITNWRPISLLNVIYKIGSSCIANRILKSAAKVNNYMMIKLVAVLIDT